MVGLAHGVVGSYADIYNGDVLRPSGMLGRARREDGTEYEAVRAPYRFPGEERSDAAADVPRLGADGEDVRAEIVRGEWDTSERLRRAG